jgi:hypothetical protein
MVPCSLLEAVHPLACREAGKLVPRKIDPLAPPSPQCCAAHVSLLCSTITLVAIRMGNTTTAWRRLRASSWPRDSGWLALFHPILAAPARIARASDPSTQSQPGCRSPQLRESAAKVPRSYRRLTGRGA